MVQLFAGATQAMMQASSTLLGVNGEATSGANDKITSGNTILAETVTGIRSAGDRLCEDCVPAGDLVVRPAGGLAIHSQERAGGLHHGLRRARE